MSILARKAGELQMSLKRRAASYTDEKALTMQEAMDYLSDRGFPCKSRSTFYRILKEFRIPYSNINPRGKHKIRRFQQQALDEFIQKQELE